jgi:hypothetical protein
MRYGTSGLAGYRQMGPPRYANFGSRLNGTRSPEGRAAYSGMSAARSSAWNRGWNRNRDLFDRRRRSFENWYVYTYPNWLGYGYPYDLDPGFFDWGDTDDTEPDNSAYDQNGAGPEAPYPDYGYGAPEESAQEGFYGEIPPESAQGEQRAGAEPMAPSAPEQPLTVIFKSGRAPVTMQNYMMSATTLTDLDSRHYEQIPIDEIDVAATEQANRAAGVGFEIPGAARD